VTGFLDEVARAEHWLEAEVSSFLCHSDLGFQWFSFGGIYCAFGGPICSGCVSVGSICGWV